MVIAFNGDVEKLKKLYADLGLKEEVVEDLVALDKFIGENDEKTVITNFNELMVADVMTADITEKKTKLFKTLGGYKKKLFVQMTKIDNELDKVLPDIVICTKMDTKDMPTIQYVFYQVKSDLPYNGKLSDDKFVLKKISEEKPTEVTLSEIKNLIG